MKQKYMFKHHRVVGAKNPPPETLNIPALTPQQFEGFSNWTTVCEVGAAFSLAGAGAVIGMLVSGPWGTMIGGGLGAGLAAYEVDTMDSVRREFEQSYEQGKAVVVWREGWRVMVYGGEDQMATEVNSPLAWLYTAGSIWVMTGKALWQIPSLRR